MKVLSFLFKQSKLPILVAATAGIVSGACNTGLIALINTALGRGAAARAGLLPAFVALCVAVPTTRIVAELLLASLGQRTIYDLRLRMCRQILAVPLRHLETLGAPRLLATLTGDIPNITGVVVLLPTLSIDGAIVLGCLVYLAWLSPAMMGVAIGLIVLGIVSYQLPIVKAMRLFTQAREQQDQLLAHFRGITEGAKELKLHRRRRDAFIGEALEPTASRYRRLNFTAQRIYTIASSWGQLLVFVVIGLLLFGLPALGMLAPPTRALVGYSLVLLYLLTPLQELMNALPGLGQAQVSLRKVEEMRLDLSSHGTEAGGAEAGGAEADAGEWRRLEMVGVRHTYHREGEEGRFVLGPIDLELTAGELLFIAGGNGSGKTTLAKLLTGLYTPEAGHILCNGQPVTDETRESFRQHFSVVFSDFFLFDTLLGLPAGADEKVHEHLRRLQLAQKVKVEGGKLSTTELSQGQRKRLALLTAYLEDRPIYVFDEWAADQDPLFKDIFYMELVPELIRRHKTVVVISHDDRYYGIADRLIKLDSGEIVEVVREPGARMHAPAEA